MLLVYNLKNQDLVSKEAAVIDNPITYESRRG